MDSKQRSRLREIAKFQCHLMLARQCRLNVFVTGQMLEYHMVADALEKMAQDDQPFETISHGGSLATSPVGTVRP